MAFGPPYCIKMPERSILSGRRQPGVEGLRSRTVRAVSQGRVLRLRRGPYPGSAQDAQCLILRAAAVKFPPL